MNPIITKQKSIINGNEAFLMGVDKSGQLIWLEVLNGAEFKCEAIISNEVDLNRLLIKKVYESKHGMLINALFNQYLMTKRFLDRHPEEHDYKNSKNYISVIKGITDILKPID